MIFAWFTALPRAVKLGLAALAGVLLAWALWSLWLGNHDQNTIKKHEAQISADVEQKQADGSKAGQTKAAAEKSKIEQENTNARTAADGSDDPLKHALDSLHP